MRNHRVTPLPRTPFTATVVLVFAFSHFGSSASTFAQAPSPPTALPTHSAMPEDSRPATTLAPRYEYAATAMLPPPSNNAPDFVPLPPMALPQPDGPTFNPEPPPAPFFSWTPTFIPPGAKSGPFQGAMTNAVYLPRMGSTGFGMIETSRQITFAVPPFISGSPILITPSAATQLLDGPTTVDLPSEVYSFELEFRYMKQLSSRWGFDLAVAPSYFGDLHNKSSDAWRVTGRAIAAWDWTPTVKLVFGGLVLGRDDYPAIPAAGFIWKPTPDWRFDVIMPRPRFSYRFLVNGEIEHRAYIGGEFGGNTWAIDRDFVHDRFTYSDLRLLLGWERKSRGGISGRFELGWVFDREIELESGLPGFTPDDTFLVRVELSF